MNNISFFLKNNVVNKDSFSIADASVAFGNWCLTPVRCLFDGNKITVSNKKGSLTVDLEKEYTDSGRNFNSFLRVVASIILIVPGVIIGCISKILGYLSPSVRKWHYQAIQSFMPVDRTIGSPEARLSLDEIKLQLQEIRKTNLHQPTKNLVVYAKEGTTIHENDPGFMVLQPKKLILVGVNFTTRYNPWYRGQSVNLQSMEDRLRRLEELVLWRKTTVDEALNDNAFDSHMIYLIQG